MAKGLPPQMTPSLSPRQEKGASLHRPVPGRGDPRHQEREAPSLQFPSLAPSKADRKQRPGRGWKDYEASWGGPRARETGQAYRDHPVARARH